MFKRLVCAFLLLVLLIAPTNVFAANEAGFSLTDVTTEKNRLFETALFVSGDVAAFTATLTFDESTINFRSAKAADENAVLSVNSTNGKVKIAYLCETGATGELVTFTFKSSAQSAFISLSVGQVIDAKANDLSAQSLKGANVTVVSASKTEDKDANKGETATATAATEATEVTKGPAVSAELPVKGGVDVTFILLFAVGAVLATMLILAAFFLGRRSAKNNNNRKT